MKEMARVILKSGKDQSLLRYHPWVFSGAIKKIYGNPAEGAWVSVYDNKETFLGKGHYQPGSIAVRILSFQDEEINLQFWVRKIQSAWKLRSDLGLTGNPESNIFRLVFGEGDGLPGFIADYYDGLVVTQMHSTGMYLEKENILEALKIVLGDQLKAVYDKSSQTIPFKGPVKTENGYWLGNSHAGIGKEYGNIFQIDFAEGQKTGFFIDQRENRKLLQELSYQRSVLNMFGYTGGFSVYALRGNARLVHTVDSSKQAVQLANQNVEKNFPADKRHSGIAADAFEFLAGAHNKYDLMILDPPAFAKHNDVLHHALQGYKKLNAKAFEAIQPGGILFTFSCSQVVSRDAFRKAVFSGAALASRSVRILHQLSQPPDHPVNIYHPEGEYLKGLVLQVE